MSPLMLTAAIAGAVAATAGILFARREHARRDYWRMHDADLEKLATMYHIPPTSRAGEQGEHWYIDRERIIAGLMARDNAHRVQYASRLALLIMLVILTLLAALAVLSLLGKG